LINRVDEEVAARVQAAAFLPFPVYQIGMEKAGLLFFVP
jgi:hypothetical protein